MGGHYHYQRDVPASKLQPLIQELVFRCGNTRKAADYIGISGSTLNDIANMKREFAHKRTARLIILALYQRRKEDRRNGASERFVKAKREQANREDRMNRLAGY